MSIPPTWEVQELGFTLLFCYTRPGRGIQAGSKERYRANDEEEMDSQGDNRFHPSSPRIVYQKCRNHRAHFGFEKSVAEGTGFRYADADVLHQSGREGLNRKTPGGTGTGKNPALQADEAAGAQGGLSK
jgi:hypothetical protein